MNQRDIKREAKFRAGLILESVMAAGWSEGVVDKYGREAADAIGSEISALATRLIEQSGASS